jgi:protein-S-isoprenylcysteine O-methyltransferase Ste14
VQRRRRAVLLSFGFVILCFAAFTATPMPYGPEGTLHESVEIMGQILLLVAVAGRTWCSLYIGGRKKTEIVDTGPYSVCRNPLYVFSVLGGFGVGAQLGSLTASVLLGFITICVFVMVVRKEEQFLESKFGVAYRAYTQRVPAFLPNFRLWRNVETMEINPRLVVRTFFEASLLLAAIPISEGIEFLQMSHVLPVFWVVP